MKKLSIELGTFLPALALGWMVSGCGSASPEEAPESTADAITRGSLVTSNVVPYSAVVEWFDGVRCTATKVGDHRFVTAAHCIDRSLATPRTITLTNSLDGASDFINVTLVKATVHPSNINNAIYPDSGMAGYDAAVLDIAEDTPYPQLPINSIYFGDGFTGDLVGYGCDWSRDPDDRDGKKQRATMTAMSRSAYQKLTNQPDAVVNDLYAHFVLVNKPNGPVICPGDSGGPTIRNSNKAVAAITSWYDCNVTNCMSYLARTSNVRLWLNDPHHNLFQDGSGGFLINAMSSKCVTSGPVQSPNVSFATSAICAAPSQDTDVQYWKLTSQPNGTFLISNGNNGLCLTPALGSLGEDPCQSINSFQWKFVPVNAGTEIAYYQLQSLANNLCLEGPSLDMKPCANKSAQRWFFTQ